MDLDKCDTEVFNNGELVGIFDMSKNTANSLCENLSNITGWKFDWNFAAGRVILRYLK